MIRDGIYKPTVEDSIEISGIEMLHPGGEALTKRTAELTGMKSGLKVLDVSSGRGTQSIFYAEKFGVKVIGLDISDEMVNTSTQLSISTGLQDRVKFVKGDSQELPFENNSFDIVINECAVGIPDDSQLVLDEMFRVLKPGGKIGIHESTWRTSISEKKKYEISERYGTTPLEYDEWENMIMKAGGKKIITEFDEWSKPSLFWNIRKGKEISDPKKIMTIKEKLSTFKRVYKQYGFKGVLIALKNENEFIKAVNDGVLGYCLYVAEK